jgi:signal transduction histidine kinase
MNLINKIPPILIKTDKRRLQQCILNLQANALKFTNKGSVNIYYTLYRRSNGKSYCEIQIKDSGIGIKDRDHPKLFKLFGFVESTADINTSGIGLGLSITKQMV